MKKDGTQNVQDSKDISLETEDIFKRAYLNSRHCFKLWAQSEERFRNYRYFEQLETFLSFFFFKMSKLVSGLGLGQTNLHPRVNVHQSSSSDRLHDAIVVLENLLQLSITVAIGGAEHQRAHDIGDGPGHRGRWVKATPLAAQ